MPGFPAGHGLCADAESLSGLLLGQVLIQAQLSQIFGEYRHIESLLFVDSDASCLQYSAVAPQNPARSLREESQFLRTDGGIKDTARIRKCLDLVGLTGYEKRLVSKLSGGQKQRIAIVRAMMMKPTTILAEALRYMPCLVGKFNQKGL